VRELDSTRLVTALPCPHQRNTTTIDDPLGQYLDVLALNEYIGWYDGGPDKIDAMIMHAYDKPLIMKRIRSRDPFASHGDENTP